MTPPEGFLCKQCGRCCLNLEGFSTSAYPEDVARWRVEGREDIWEWVDIFYFRGLEGGYNIWISPVTGEEVPRCPWLRKYPKKEHYYCRIHDTKPKRCRDYPLDKKQVPPLPLSGLPLREVRILHSFSKAFSNVR